MSQFLSFWRVGLLASGLLLGAGGLAPTQAQGPGNNGPAGPAAGATAVPLDGGASLLLAAGVGLGLRQLRRRRAARG